MQALREIVTPKDSDIKISLPSELSNRKVEVIIFPYDVPARRTSRKKRLKKIFDESQGTLPVGYRFNRDEAHER
ncbi:MAG: hypothetical protein WC156_03535 [Pedobacter sp.]